MFDVVHLSETMGGGIGVAVSEYCEAAESAGLSVAVWAMRRPDDSARKAAEQVELAPVSRFGGWAFRMAAQTWSQRRQSTVFHAHSSRAGFVLRCLPWVVRSRIVYSPHGFAFERTDLRPLHRRLIWLAERLLARRTGSYACVGQHELDLAKRLCGDVSRCHLVPHQLRFSIDVDRLPATQPAPVVVGLGRLAVQKDPLLFGRITALLRGPGIRPVWVGDGDEALRRQLEDVGVTVTGWLDRHDAMAELNGALCLLLTSAWEGFPYTAVEAVALGVPVVFKRIPALEAEFGHGGFGSADEAAHLLTKLLADETARTQLLHDQASKLTVVGTQAHYLRAVYRIPGGGCLVDSCR